LLKIILIFHNLKNVPVRVVYRRVTLQKSTAFCKV